MTNRKGKNKSRAKQVGLAIADLRKQKGMTQKELAKKVGISLSYLSKIEAPNVEQEFYVHILVVLADALEMREWEILEYSKKYE